MDKEKIISQIDNKLSDLYAIVKDERRLVAEACGFSEGVFRVGEYVGDYPLENQLYWGHRWSHPADAIEVATECIMDMRQKQNKAGKFEHYTDYYYVTVEIDDDEGTPVAVITAGEVLYKDDMHKYLSKFE